MQVLLAVEHTIFKINASTQEYQKITDFINKYFDAKSLQENIIFIPMTKSTQDNRKVLMKWLYSYYKKDSKNFNPKLQFELVKRMNKPVHIHFLPKQNQQVDINTTFYENSICQLALNVKNQKVQEHLLEYFSGCINIKSELFALYELNVTTKYSKKLLALFLSKKELSGVPVSISYDRHAAESFLNAKKINTPEYTLEKAFKLLKVDKTDSFSSIKRTYKKLAKTYHPDLSSLTYDESTKKFQILSDAFSLIKKYKAVA